MTKTPKKKEGFFRLLELAETNKTKLTFACTLSVLSSMFKIIPYFTIYMILRKIITVYYKEMPFTFSSVSILVYITAASAVMYGVCAYSSAMFSHGAAFDILYDLRMKLMEKMGKISSGYYTANSQGGIKKLIIEDVEQIEIFIAHSMCEVAAAIATPLFTIVVLFITDWRLTLVSLIPIICSFVILAMALRKPDGAAHQKNMAESKAKMEGTIVEYIHGMSVIKIFGDTKNAFKRYETDLNSFTKAVHDTAYYNANGMGLYYAFFGAQVLFLLPATIIMMNYAGSYADVLPKALFFLIVCAGLKEPLALCRFFGLQRVMELPPEKAKKLFAKAYKGVVIPDMNDDEINISQKDVKGSTCVWYKHKNKCERACIYIVGGGMLKYPKPSQAKEVLSLAKELNVDFVLPFYPLVHTGNTLPDVYDMMYTLYKNMLNEYSADEIYFLGCSSGANLALGLISYINDLGEGLPMPGKVYAGSPGSLLISDEERKKADLLDKTDVIMSQKATLSVWEGMTGGKKVANYMESLQLGDYTGLKDVYLSFGADEVFTACADSIKKRLEEYGVHVTMEIEEGLYHAYACLPLVKDAMPGYERMKKYIKG